MATAAERRAYARKLNEVAGRLGRLERDTLQQSIALLKGLRDRVAGQVTQGEFNEWRVREMTANLNEMIASYEGQLRALSNGSVTSAFGLGQASVIEPLQEVGFTNLFFTPTPAQLNVLVDFSADLIGGIADDLRRGINREIRLAALGGKSSVQTMKDITRLMGIPPKRSDPTTGVAYEAERILRTETNRAYSLATFSQQQELAAQVPGLQKQWLATGDKRTRESHLIAHKQIVDVDKPFIVGGAKMMFPHDPAGPPQETINCRCTSITVIPEIGPLPSPLDAEVEEEIERRKAAERPAKAKPERPEKIMQPTQLQPAGKPITDNNVAFDPSDEESKEQFADATFETINSVHGTGDLPRLRAYHRDLAGTTDQNLIGLFERRYDFEDEAIKPVHILVNKGVQQTVGGKGATLTHELGHFLDAYGINKDGNFASVAAKKAFEEGSEHVLKDWYAAVNNSQSVQQLREMQANPTAHIQTYKLGDKTYKFTPSDRVLNYLQQPDELFARSYAQYVAERGNTSLAREMVDELAKLRPGVKGDYPLQWSTDDFAPIAREFDKAFKVLGWLT